MLKCQKGTAVSGNIPALNHRLCGEKKRKRKKGVKARRKQEMTVGQTDAVRSCDADSMPSQCVYTCQIINTNERAQDLEGQKLNMRL